MKRIFHFIALASLFVIPACKEQVAPPKPLEVPVTTVVKQDVRLESEYTGQTFGQSDIKLMPRVDGVILSMNFQEGGMVTEGQVLYTIDPLPYQAKVNESEADLAEQQANLARAKSDLDMIEPLAKINAVSQRELVEAKANYEAAKSKIKAAEATLTNSRIKLGYCQVIAPISGLIGISKVRVGDYVQPGPTAVINTISNLGDIRVRFTMNEQEFLRIFREITKENSPLKESGDSVTIKLSDGSVYDRKGKISFADRQIDPTTGALTFEAQFTNPNKILRPGQYVKVSFVTQVRPETILVPQRAVMEMQGIFQVYVVNDSNKVQMQIIEVGPAYKDSYIVESGLKEGDKIAFGGTQLLKNGATITPKKVEWLPGVEVK